MTVVRPTFEVDKKGMAQVFARRGKAFIVTELIQNAWDENTTQVDVILESIGKGKARLVVEDNNPEGFIDLSHAYTLFAPSLKKDDPEKRGRFNIGEKLVIALFDSARITTTKGTVVFSDKGRVHSRKKRKAGSIFEGVLSLTEAEISEIQQTVNALLPPKGVATTFNLADIPTRKPLRKFEAALRTEVADEDGRLKPTTRKTTVELFEPRPGEVPTVYELGIPVVAIEGDRFHVNVGQKVPLPLDRDNLPPAYLRHVRVEVLNNAYDLLKDEDFKAAWVSNALEDERVIEVAADAAFKGKFGDKAVTFDPNDPEANKLAVVQGYTVVPGGSLPKAAWKNVKGHGIVQPAGQVTPSPSMLHNQAKATLKPMDPDHYPAYVENVVEFAKDFARELLGVEISVSVVNAATAGFDATFEYKGTELTLNLGSLGHKWFDSSNAQGIIDLLFDEFAHRYADDHLDVRYYRALRALGAKAVMLAFEKPEVYERLGLVSDGSEFIAKGAAA